MPLIQNNIELFTKKIESLSCGQAINEGSQISFLKANSEAFVKTALQLLVNDVLIHYGALEKVLEVSRERIVNTILGKYWWMKLEEIAYCFNRGKNGCYEKYFGIPSEAMFLGWLNEYDINERENERLNFNKSLQEKTNSNQILSDEQLKEFYKNNIGVDNSEKVPDGSERMHERQKDDSEYQKEKMRILSNLKKDIEE